MANVAENEVEFKPRDYQIKLYEAAKRENTIVCLGTGTGKTFIAILLMKDPEFHGELLGDYNRGAKRTVFLAPTKPLVKQQASEIRRHWPHVKDKVGEYTGEKNVDLWSKAKWIEELAKHQVLVMVPQILLDVLNHGLIDFSKINLLIIDEAHWAAKKKGNKESGHPVKQIMNIYKKSLNKPRILALTASLINRALKATDFDEAINDIKTTYMAVCNTSNVAELCGTNPEELVWSYNSLGSSPSPCAKKVVSVLQIFIENIKQQKIRENTSQDSMPLGLERIKKCFVNIKNMLTDSTDSINPQNENPTAMSWMGIWCANVATDLYIEEFNEYIELYQNLNPSYAEILRNILMFLSLIHESFKPELTDRMSAYTTASEKMLRLLELLSDYNPSNGQTSELCGIVFVNQRSVAKVLTDWINQMKEIFPQKYGFLKVDWVVGHSSKPGFETLVASYSNKKQQKTIHDFREKELNLLISTAVLEEGLDVRQCNVVVRYDKPVTFRQYLQSKGRARAVGARYYMITSNEDSDKLSLELMNYRIMEEKIKNLNQISITDSVANDCDDDEEEFMTKSGGARITTKTSIALLYRYCQKLTTDSFTKLEPCFELITPAFDLSNPTITPRFKYSVRLPVNCPIKEKINGDIRGSSSKAKRNAAFYACKALYECGELDENFLPVSKEMFIEKYISDLGLKHYNDKDSNSGIKNSQQIYPKRLAQVFSKPDFTPNKYYLHSIAINHPTIESSNVITFGAITSRPITNSCKFSVFVKMGKTGVHFSSLKTIHLKARELDSIKKFHCFTFNNTLQIENNGIIYSPMESKFDLLLVPLKNQDIDWLFVKLIENQTSNEVKLGSVSERLGFEYNPDLYKDTVVYPLYRTEDKFGFYKVLETTEMTPKSIFTESKKYKTYEQFYRVKYGLEICNKTQNMFEGKLVDKFAQIKTFFVKQKTAKTLEKRQFFVPELVAIHPFPNSLWKQALCLPSIIYRLNYLFLAEELRLLIHSETIPSIGNLNPLNNMLKLDDDYDLEMSDENDNEIGLKRIHSDDENDAECDGHPFAFESKDNEININVKPLRKRQKNVKSEIKVIKDSKKSNQSPLHSSNYNITSVVRVDSENELIIISKQLILQFNQLLINNNCRMTDFNINDIVYEQMLYEEQKAILNNRPPSYGEAFPFIFDGDINDHIREKYDQNVCEPIRGPTADLLLNALTLLNANDSINLERLETIGDSFLKFITTANLYYCCPELDEGRLTYLRQIQICNCNLFHIGIEKNLSQLLVATKFYPNVNWLPPRYQTTDENDCLLITHDKLAHCHHLISDKSIADSVEALIGAHLLSGGNKSALIFMQWLGLKVSKNELDFNNNENKRPTEIWTWLPKPTSPVFSHIDRNESIRAVDNLYRNCNLSQFEKMIGYEFRDKAYLIQALTHSSYFHNNITDCYQRLEFLGDAVLDYLITRHIFRDPTKFSPGEITDLRSALVNNSFFASIAVKYSYHKYLKLFSIDLYRAVERFVKKFESEKTKTIENCFNSLTDEDVEDLEEVEVPKALGDIFESVAGAIFLDNGLSLDSVWKVYYKMIKPEIDYFSENVPKMPVRELRELCESKNKKIEFSGAKIISGRRISMTITIGGKEYTGFGINKNFAKIAASKSALKALKKTKK